MKYHYITFRSVTYGQKAERILKAQGIRCTLLRTPRWMEERGCGYCLRLWARDLDPALGSLHSHQLPYRKIYVMEQDGRLEEKNL